MKNKVFIIAEIGPNHNGSYKRALKMIKQLLNSGVDCIKFQLSNPDKVYSKNSFLANYQKKGNKNNSAIAMANKLQLKREEHYKISKFCKKNKLIYGCTAFDLDSLIFLDKKINVPFFKIASGEVFSLDMLNYLSKTNKPIFLSTGMSTIKQIKLILTKLERFKKKNITIMHCVSSYPAKNKQLNLNIIDELKKKFNYDIGYSDHSMGNDACLAAVAKGAKVIEKHVTLSQNLKGPDHKSSATIKDFKLLVKKIRELEIILGNSKKNFSKEEIHIHKVARKSIVTKKKIFKNERVKMQDLCFKRPGTGISPFDLSKVVGKRANRNLDENIVIKKNFLK